MASLSNSRWQNREESPNWFTNNGNMTETAKHNVVCEWVNEGVSESVSDILVKEKLIIFAVLNEDKVLYLYVYNKLNIDNKSQQ